MLIIRFFFILIFAIINDMDQYEIRVNQLKKLKLSIFIKILIILSIIIAIGVLVYYLICSSQMNIAYLEYVKSQTDNYFTVIYFISLAIICLIVTLILLKYENRRYKKFYLECLYAECKLEEIFLLNHKTTSNKALHSFILRVFKLNHFHQIKSFSDASRKFSLDIAAIIYRKEKTGRGTLLSVHFDQEKTGFLQLTHDNYCSFDSFENKEIIQFGTPPGSLLKDFHIFSTYKKIAYALEKNENARKIALLERYFSSPIDIVFDNDNLQIFIQRYSLQLEDSLFRKINNQRFNEKMEAIRNFHKTIYDVIDLFDDLLLKEDTN